MGTEGQCDVPLSSTPSDVVDEWSSVRDGADVDIANRGPTIKARLHPGGSPLEDHYPGTSLEQ